MNSFVKIDRDVALAKKENRKYSMRVNGIDFSAITIGPKDGIAMLCLVKGNKQYVVIPSTKENEKLFEIDISKSSIIMSMDENTVRTLIESDLDYETWKKNIERNCKPIKNQT
ncbi:MAG: hypothetical protein ACFFB2_20450 [Promethearchaeota archaeon]